MYPSDSFLIVRLGLYTVHGTAGCLAYLRPNNVHIMSVHCHVSLGGDVRDFGALNHLLLGLLGLL